MWNTQTFIAGLTCEALIAPWVIKGAMDGPAFETDIRTQLAPALKPGTVLRRENDPPDHFLILLILDNLATHKNAAAAQALKAQGCWFLYLPPYSPDLNPAYGDCLQSPTGQRIEMAFSKLKAHLRKIGARTFDQLLKAIGDVCKLFSHDECQNYFNAAGYDPR